MEKDNKKLSRAEKLGVWLASTKFGQLAFTNQKNINIFMFSFMLFTHGVYWATAWWSPWPYIFFTMFGVWFNEGLFNQYANIIKQAVDKNWNPSHLLIAIPFMLLNNIAFFACLYMFGNIVDVEGNQIEGVWNHFYFSTVTLTTLGYGNIILGDLVTEIIATIEALLGFMGFAVLAGVIASIAVKRAEFK